MKNFLTFNQLDYQCLKQAGNLSDSDIYLATRQGYINSKMMKIYALLDGLNDPFYNRSTVLTPAADQEFLKDEANSVGTIMTLTVSGLTITIERNTGSFVAGEMLSIARITKSTGNPAYACVARVTTGGAVATATIISGNMATFAGASQTLSVIALKSFSVLTADVSGIYFKDFVAVYDDMYTAVPGAGIRVFDLITDPKVFYNRSLDVNATKRPACYQKGDNILFYLPSAANAFGTITGEYRGKPALFDDSTINNVIDMPPENNQILIDEVVASYLIEVNKPIPQDIATRTAQYAKMYEAANADKAKTMERANK
jgi:hypothetical protein